MGYGFSKTVRQPFERAIEKVTEELKKEGFGVLTSIDVKDIFQKKLNVDFDKYTILGACNPSFAHQALMTEEQIGLLLPCNVIVYEKDGKITVAAFDPMSLVRHLGIETLRPITEQIEARLRRVIEAVN